MARVIRKHWATDLDAGLSRRDRRSCDYDAYVPDVLAGRRIALDGDTAADIADAERAIATLDAGAVTLADTEALARILLRAECVASSRIEGLEVGARRLLRAEAAQELGEQPTDMTAIEVLANINAMSSAIQGISPGNPITVDQLLAFHRTLLADTRLSAHAGVIRNEQNWIGGSNYNPCSAAFIPPPPEYVPGLLEDLCRFGNDDTLPAVAQAAIAHAQFETIHPFVDGNGRTGRALIHLVLRRRGLATRTLLPISLVLATWANDYIVGLEATRYRGPASSKAAHDGLNLWVARFAAAAKRAVNDAGDMIKDTADTVQDFAGKYLKRSKDVVGDVVDSAQNVVTAAKRVTRMLRPSDAPICWETLMRPEAAPASSGATPRIPSPVSGMSAAPIPTPRRAIGIAICGK